jgi:hypothetical protein
MTSELVLHSDWAIYLLPLPAAILTAIIACAEFRKTRQWNVPRAMAVGIPIPLAMTYFLLFMLPARSFADWLSIIRFIAPHALVLAFIGIWLAIAMIRGREVTMLSSLTIFLVVFVGHLWMMIVVSTLSGYR